MPTRQPSALRRTYPTGVPEENPCPAIIPSRMWEALALHVNAGWTAREIAKHYDVSEQRARLWPHIAHRRWVAATLGGEISPRWRGDTT